MPSAEEYKQQQKSTWNKFSGGWKKWDSVVMNWLQPTGAVIIENAALKPGDRVMDMATGTGEPGLSAAKVVGGGTVLGVDLAEEMLAVAREKAASRGVNNYSTHVFDGSHVPFEDNSFDAVISRFGVIFSPEPVALMADMVRVLKPGGRMSVSAWAAKEENPWATMAAGVVARHLDVPQPPPDAPGIFRYCDSTELKRDMEAAGLKQVEISPVSGEFTMKSAQEYWQYTTEIVAPIAIALAKADAGTIKKIAETVMGMAGNYEKDGKVVFPWKSWVLSGVK